MSNVISDQIDYEAIYHSVEESNELILLTEIKKEWILNNNNH